MRRWAMQWPQRESSDHRRLRLARERQEAWRDLHARARLVLRELAEAFPGESHCLPEEVDMSWTASGHIALTRRDLNGTPFSLRGPIPFGDIPLVFQELLHDNRRLHGNDPAWLLRGGRGAHRTGE